MKGINNKLEGDKCWALLLQWVVGVRASRKLAVTQCVCGQWVVVGGA